MAVTYVASTAGTTTAALPAGTVTGDIVVVFAYSSSATTPTLPASWTNISNNAATPATRAQYRVYDGVWTMPTFTNAAQTHALTMRGGDTVTPIGVTSITNGSSTNPVFPLVTLTDNDGSSGLLRGLNHTRPDSVITAPTGHTSRQASGTQPGWMTCTKNSTTDGAAATVTISRATTWTQNQVEIKCAPYPVDTLVDPFTTLSAQWHPWDANTTLVAGQVRIAPAFHSTAYTGIERTDRFILRGSKIAVECVDAGNQSLASWEAYPLELQNDAASATVQFFIGTGNISANMTGVGSVGTVAYSPTAHRFLQIRETAGTTYFETSPDGSTWSTLHSRPTSTLPAAFNPDRIWVKASAGTWSATEASATALVIDNVNSLPGVTQQTAATLTATSTLTSTAGRSAGGSGALSATSTLTATAGRAQNATSSLSAVSLLTAGGAVTTPDTVDPDTRAYLTATGLNEATYGTTLDALVTGLKSNGLWSKMTAIYPFIGGTEALHRWNLKDPRDLDAAFRLTYAAGDPSQHSLALGYRPNEQGQQKDSPRFADTNLVPATALTDVNSTHLAFYSLEDTPSADRAEMGCYNWAGSGSRFHIIARYLGVDSFYYGMSEEGANHYVVPAASGLFVATRTSASAQRGYRNGVPGPADSFAPTNGLPNRSVYIGAINEFANRSDIPCGFASIGNGLADTDVTALWTVVEAYQSALGRATTVVAPVTQNGAANLTAAATLTAAPVRGAGGTAPLAATSSLTAVAVRAPNQAAVAALTATSTLPFLAALRTVNAGATLTAASTLTSTATTAGGGFTPDTLTGLAVWLDAADYTPGAWTNRGAGPAPTVVGGPVPVVSANSLNGHPLVRYTVSEGRHRILSGSGVDKEWTLAYVARNVGPTHGRIVNACYPPNNLLVGFWTDSCDVMYDAGFASNGQGVPLVEGEWKTYSGDGALGSNSRLFSDGVLLGEAVTPAGWGGTLALSGYAPDVSSETNDCEVAEVVQYDRKLTDAERAQVEKYLRDKWFAPAGPATVNATAALAATSTLTATGTRSAGGTAPLTSTATLTAVATKTSTTTATATLTASSFLFAAATTTPATGAAVTLTATATLTATGSRATTATVTLTATSSLSTAGVRGPQATVTLTATATLVGTGLRIVPALVTLTAAATLTGDGVRQQLVGIPNAAHTGYLYALGPDHKWGLVSNPMG